MTDLPKVIHLEIRSDLMMEILRVINSVKEMAILTDFHLDFLMHLATKMVMPMVIPTETQKPMEKLTVIHSDFHSDSLMPKGLN